MQRLKTQLTDTIKAIYAFSEDVVSTVIRRTAQVLQQLARPGQDMKPTPVETLAIDTIESAGKPASRPVGQLVRQSARVRLRRHIPSNREAFQRWYADPEIAYLLRHDLRPLNDRQSRGYFDSVILPLSAAGRCFAIHDAATDQLIGTTALTEPDDGNPNALLFRIVIGEKTFWDLGLGTEATRLVVEEAFNELGLNEVRLEVFAHNPRAISVYERVGFVRTGEHTEWMGPDRPRLHVFEMSLTRSRDEEPDNLQNDSAEDSEHLPHSRDTPAFADPI